MNYSRTTQTPNEVFDLYLPFLSESELKVLLIILRRTIGFTDPKNRNQRVARAWITQKLFMKLTGLSNRAVSTAIDSLQKREIIRVYNSFGQVLVSREERRHARLYFGLRLQPQDRSHKTKCGGVGIGATTTRVASEDSSGLPVNNGHIIKLKREKYSCEDSSLLHFQSSCNVTPPTRLTDHERYRQLLDERRMEA